MLAYLHLQNFEGENLHAKYRELDAEVIRLKAQNAKLVESLHKWLQFAEDELGATLTVNQGPDFNQEVNLHADTISERYDLLSLEKDA